MFNLIEERWIPVRTESGRMRYIAPWEIADTEDRPVDVRFERPDFNSAVTQFLIAVCQTVYEPKDDAEWLDTLESRPTADDMHSRMMAISEAFELLGDGSRYMQDDSAVEAESSSKKEKSTKKMTGMLLNSPGENTVELGKDFFEKDKGTGGLCLSCSAAALTALQFMAPLGGSGYNPCIREGSAMTVLIRGNDLWETVYLNVLTHGRMRRTGGDNDDADPFVWMTPSESRQIVPTGNNPAMAVWAMVRRIHLEDPSDGVCTVCGCHGQCIRAYQMKNKGYEYLSWIHPLAPTTKRNEEIRHLQMGTSIRHFNQWSALAYGGQAFAIPSLNVSQVAYNRNDVREIIDSSYRLWICGYQNKQASPESWIDVTVPVYIGYDDSDRFESFVLKLVKLSDKALKVLIGSLRSAVERKGENGKSKDRTATMFDKNDVSERFWTICDSEFESIVGSYSESDADSIIETWMGTVRDTATSVFDSVTDSLSLEYYGQVVQARSGLRRRLSMKSLSKELSA